MTRTRLVALTKNHVQSELITVWINGEPEQVRPNQSVLALLESLDIPGDRVAVELNKAIVRNRDWDKTIVPNGAHIEVVEFVGGG